MSPHAPVQVWVAGTTRSSSFSTPSRERFGRSVRADVFGASEGRRVPNLVNNLIVRVPAEPARGVVGTCRGCGPSRRLGFAEDYEGWLRNLKATVEICCREVGSVEEAVEFLPQ